MFSVIRNYALTRLVGVTYLPGRGAYGPSRVLLGSIYLRLEGGREL